MNLILNLGEMSLSWAFPQFSASIKAYQWGKTAYKVCKVSSGLLLGDPMSVADGFQIAAKKGLKLTCWEQYKICKDHIGSGSMGDGGTGWGEAGCWVAFLACKFFKWGAEFD